MSCNDEERMERDAINIDACDDEEIGIQRRGRTDRGKFSMKEAENQQAKIEGQTFLRY